MYVLILPILYCTVIDLPLATYGGMTSDKCGRKLPDIIAHRGFRNKYPENTMGAFRGAVEAGSHAIETDLHLSRDGVVVISHVHITKPG